MTSKQSLDQQVLLKKKRGKREKTFRNIFLVLSVALVILPFVTTFNEFLTRIVINVKIYKLIQDFIVPFESRLVAVVLKIFSINSAVTQTGIFVSSDPNLKNGVMVVLSWNCIGWQSLVLLFFTFLTGLQGPYTISSKIECASIGILGTFLVNIFRMSTVVLVAFFFGRLPAIIFHDYGSTLLVIGWLFLFWYFSYALVLEPKLMVEERPKEPSRLRRLWKGKKLAKTKKS